MKSIDSYIIEKFQINKDIQDIKDIKYDTLIGKVTYFISKYIETYNLSAQISKIRLNDLIGKIFSDTKEFIVYMDKDSYESLVENDELIKSFFNEIRIGTKREYISDYIDIKEYIKRDDHIWVFTKGLQINYVGDDIRSWLMAFCLFCSKDSKNPIIFIDKRTDPK